MMDSEAESPKTLTTTRHKCSACFKQYKKKEHLVEHMIVSYHSRHQPKCGVCIKHCKTFESLREHLTGPLSKATCSKIFASQGCSLCMKVFDSPASLSEHKEKCQFPAPVPLEMPCTESHLDTSSSNIGAPSSNPKAVAFSAANNGDHSSKPNLIAISVSNSAYRSNDHKAVAISAPNNRDLDWDLKAVAVSVPNNVDGSSDLKAVAIDCEMVGGGSDGSLDVCARVCLIEEDENLIFHTYVQPQIPVTNFRYEVTGITEEHLRDAMPLREVQEILLQILCNGESIGRVRLDGGKARLLVGHDLEHDLKCLRMHYPDHLLRYDIQSGVHDPYIDCVSAMRLYKRIRAQDHCSQGLEASVAAQQSHNLMTNGNSFDNWKPKELESMTPDELFQISKSNYKCWCLDSRP
ncbi:RNA exonuclease 4-like isoform X2 [Diospyros lotus]|uniref:RNA exonuclease 4-like isoform X2 n=1 Tax=Diospyros lotus TaxID=55363 RepID=UPI002259CF7F|nr:RNA exonuclease 4-like isoform X2 [Diospyros lotus]